MSQDPYRDTSPDPHEPTREHWADRAEAYLSVHGWRVLRRVALVVVVLLCTISAAGAALACALILGYCATSYEKYPWLATAGGVTGAGAPWILYGLGHLLGLTLF